MKKKQQRIDFTKKFIKQLQKAPLAVKTSFRNRLQQFKKDPFTSILNNHQLKGKLRVYRSINVTGDWRALYLENINKPGETVIIFSLLGTHSQLYK